MRLITTGRSGHSLIISEPARLIAVGPSGEVLALSVGGSTTKLMLAKIEGGQICVSHLAVVKNPTVPTHFYYFLDELFLRDPRVREYLTEAAAPSLCVTLPVMIGEDNIPFHPVKIACVTHMLARNDAEMTEELNLPE